MKSAMRGSLKGIARKLQPEFGKLAKRLNAEPA